MNVQAHMSGKVSGQVPSQIPQQSGNPLQPQMQNIGGGGGGGMDAELIRARPFMQQKICTVLAARKTPVTDEQKRKFFDFVRRLEDGLFKTAQSREEYLNLDTLERRLQALIRRSSLNHGQQLHQSVTFSSGATMIPTPGISHNPKANMISSSSVGASMVSANNCIATTNVNTGSLLPMGGVSMAISNGSFSNGYPQSASSFSMGSGGNHMSSMGGQRMASQMIPTPGFNSNNNSQYLAIMDSINGGGFSTVDSTMVSQQQQKQQIGGQNNRGLHMNSGLRTGLQQKSIGFSNGSLGSGLGMMGSNLHFANGPGISEGYLTATPYANSAKPFQQKFEQHQRPLMQSDAYGMNSADSSGPGSLYGVATSVGSLINSHNISSGNMQAISNANLSTINNQSNFHNLQQAANMSPQSFDHPEKMNFHSSLSSRDNSVQSHHQQHFVQQQHHLKMQSQQDQLMIKNEPFGQMQLSSNLGTQLKPEPGLQQHAAVLQQASHQFQQPGIQNQIISGDSGSGAAHMDSTSSAQHDLCSTFSQGSQQMQQLHQHLGTESQSDYSSFPAGAHSESVMQNQWHPQSQERIQIPVNTSARNILEDSCQGRSGKDGPQPEKLSSDASAMCQPIGSRSKAEPHNSGIASCRPGNLYREQDFRNQQRWLLFLLHARRCRAPEGKCPENHCITVQKLWKHMEGCRRLRCAYPRCHASKSLLNHNLNCRDLGCPVCVPFKKFCARYQLKAQNRPGAGDASTRLVGKTTTGRNEDFQSAHKRAKIEQPLSPIPEGAKSALEASANSEYGVPHDVQKQDYHINEISMPQKPEVSDVKIGASVSSSHGSISTGEMNEANIDDHCNQMPGGEPKKSDEHAEIVKQENSDIEEKSDAFKQVNLTQVAENAAGPKSGKPTIKGVSLTELFTPEQVGEHIRGLRQWVGQSKAKAEKNQAMGHSMSENSCQLCAVEKLTFEPPPIYCSTCGARIKRNATYYTGGAGDTRHYFCIPCYNESRGDTINVDGASMPKARLEKKKNDEETEEWWVQCDKCEAWQHQICALFNGRRNDGGQAEYTCPNCYIGEVERGERKPLPQSAVLGAKDLPQTFLSEHIERRLSRKLQMEKEERAKHQGKSIDEIPEANELVVRVVSSVDKKLEVKPRFLEIFQEQNYPTEFPYKSKVILLFQKIEGVEVCLFGMYVQEFGAECAFPNQRRVYLSYLDSVKYFRPEVRAITGEALRTFVYHEILIGYLEYCKIRGFTSCYIWACPPLKGEDYILYCHPEIQKTPKSDKLREWYLAMLRKAAKENVVVDLTNLYDHFFTQKGECKAKVTAARLPYFDGDYWPGAAEDLLYQMQQEEDGRKNNRKGLTKKTISKRALKASGQTDLSGNASKDLLLMHKLGETISPMREDFIMVHLQHCCNHCCILMVSGTRWVCQQCKNFQLCDKCYEVEQNREDRERHPINHKEKHSFNPIEITDVPADTKDKDDILESEFFDTRQAFLSLCQGNHYQYDTLRRAKHSSMMVLYHLHNPTAPAFVTTCNVCHLDIEAGQGWRCEVCPDYDICNACYQKDGGISHPHKLTNHPSVADRDAQNKEARQLRVQQLRKMLELLVHASQCRSLQCQYPNCRKVKGLFRHGMQCRVRASGGCVLCKKMWYLLQLHARACKISECYVPRCRDLREHLRRLQQQSESRRRAAVNEMMRQRAAEVAGNA